MRKLINIIIYALEDFPKNTTCEALTQKRENMDPVVDNYDIVQKKDSLLNLVVMGPEKRKISL